MNKQILTAAMVAVLVSVSGSKAGIILGQEFTFGSIKSAGGNYSSSTQAFNAAGDAAKMFSSRTALASNSTGFPVFNFEMVTTTAPAIGKVLCNANSTIPAGALYQFESQKVDGTTRTKVNCYITSLTPAGQNLINTLFKSNIATGTTVKPVKIKTAGQ